MLEGNPFLLPFPVSHYSQCALFFLVANYSLLFITMSLTNRAKRTYLAIMLVGNSLLAVGIAI